MTTFIVDIDGLDTVLVEVIDETFEIEIVEENFDVEVQIYEDTVNADIVDETIPVDIVEDVIEVLIDDCCLATAGGGDSEHHIKTFDHDDVSIVAGDLVYLDTVIHNKVNKAINNNSPNPVIGIVYQVLSETSLRVLMLGAITITETLPPGSKVYVSVTGLMTETLQSENFIQVLGTITGEFELLINPEKIRVKRLEYV